MAESKGNVTQSVTTSFPVLALISGILFILKVAGDAGTSWGVVGMSYWTVFAPILYGLAVAVVILLVVALVILVIALLDK
jgi:Na+/H+-translocating membrane pyrophosphatase